MKQLTKVEIEKLTPKEFQDYQMSRPENNMTNCWYELRVVKMDLTKANELLKTKK